jgi:hypothetical protein
VDFEQAIVDAIVTNFFQPQPFPSLTTGPDGMAVSTVGWGAPPAQPMALAIYESHKNEILAAVVASLDADLVAGQVTKRILTDLLETRPSWSSQPTKGEQFRKEVRLRVIEKLADLKVLAVLADEADPD